MASLAVDDLLGAPYAVVETILLDLEPASTDARVRGRVVDLLEVGERGALVGAVHDVVGRRPSRAEHVAPDGRHILAGLDGDDLGRGLGGVGVAVAGDRVREDVLDRPVVRGDADAVSDALVDTADLERAENGVSAGSAGGDERGEELHGNGRVV